MPTHTAAADVAHELILTRLIGVPREKRFRCRTEPALMTQWFTPPPWKTVAAEIDLRVVFSDAFISAWVPSAKPLFTGIHSVEDEAGQTRCTARASHRTAEDCAAHEKRGFHEGWGIATTQLAALAATL